MQVVRCSHNPYSEVKSRGLKNNTERQGRDRGVKGSDLTPNSFLTYNTFLIVNVYLHEYILCGKNLDPPLRGLMIGEKLFWDTVT